MGFTFQVFPTSEEQPALSRVEQRATELLRLALVQFPLERMVVLPPELLERARQSLARNAERARIQFDASAVLGEAAAIFRVSPGGGLGEVRRVPTVGWIWYEPELSRLRERGLDERWPHSLALGYRCEVSRLLGEPALSAIAHGFVAAALAEQTSGFLFSPDGAWDSALLPCSGEEFLQSFMRPERSSAERFRRYAEDKLRALPEELELFDEAFVDSVLQQIASLMVAEMNEVRGNAEAELAVIERALTRMETARVISRGRREAERRILIGTELGLSCDGAASALSRLRPTAEEYERWLGHIGELLP
ncbi:MAG: hypothetical protein ACOX6T_20985 [Myxococcales bacterium]|jgi:hypothetical protein